MSHNLYVSVKSYALPTSFESHLFPLLSSRPMYSEATTLPMYFSLLVALLLLYSMKALVFDTIYYLFLAGSRKQRLVDWERFLCNCLLDEAVYHCRYPHFMSATIRIGDFLLPHWLGFILSSLYAVQTFLLVFPQPRQRVLDSHSSIPATLWLAVLACRFRHAGRTFKKGEANWFLLFSYDTN